MKKYFVVICQVIIGLTFVLSGIVKCIDPIGTSIKLHDYFAVLGLSWISDWTLFFAWCLCLIEFLIGLNILFGRNLKIFSTLAALFMIGFTPLTLYLAIANPVADCGCFGDAIILTNWQTFWKNVVLLIAALSICIFNSKCYKPTRGDFFTIITYYELVIAVLLCFIGTNRLPIIDFRPFRPGVNVPQAMGNSDNLDDSSDVLYVCVYEKDGIRQEFPIDQIPDEDEGWEFIESKEISADGSIVTTDLPEIKDFFLFDEFGSDLTEDILIDPNYSFLLISPNLADAEETYLDRIENIYEYSMENEYNFYCVTLNDSVNVNAWKYKTGAEYDFLYSDATILETMIRSNPGLMLLKEGTILWKSCMHNVNVDELTSAKLTEHSYGKIIDDNKKSRIFWLVFLMLAPILVYLPIEKAIILYNKKSTTKTKK